MKVFKKKFSDQEIIKAIVDNQKLDDYIKQLFSDCFASVTRFVGKYYGNKEDAEDIFQNALLVFIDLVKKDRFRGESSIKTYFIAICKHLWMNERKKKYNEQQREEKYFYSQPQFEEDVELTIHEREKRQGLFELFEKLGPTCKEILIQFYFYEKPIKEILECLNYENEQVVRNKKYKCMKKLTDMIRNDSTIMSAIKNYLVS
ncbi:sigma-70 family RNA polymerase sigma factor [Rapidithrix thailandica]|uniref:Sigma-70 family RNA polymerase sigma factor n=1 Tax=Rapidithrix thailandica TaxID=413964 RepID=A0AAW9S6F4_9BACT